MKFQRSEQTPRREKRLTICLALAVVAGAITAPAVHAATADSSSVAAARDLSAAFRSASEHVLHAVVAIESRAAEPTTEEPLTAPKGFPEGANPFEGSPFEELFRQQFKRGGPTIPKPHRRGGIGSGVIIHRTGLILTNNHVVDGADKVIVRLQDGREFEAYDVKTDPKTDIAILRIKGDNDFPFAELGDSDAVEIGDWVLALGQPFGLESTVTAGIISAKHRGIGITDRENFLQTDAAINPGNSGGPLVNLDGKVIGINTAISSRSGGNDGIGFAIPVNLARWVGKQLVAKGEVSRAFLGVGIQPVTADLAEQFHVAPRQGVLINQVHADTPAEKAGLQSGDVIIEFAGKAVSSPRELQLLVERADIEKSQNVTVQRDGERIEIALRLAALPETFTVSEQRSEGAKTGRLESLGLAVENLSAADAGRMGMDGVRGVLVTGVRRGSAAQEKGIEAGSVITHANHKPVENLAMLNEAIQSGSDDQGVLLSLRTASGSRFVVLK